METCPGPTSGGSEKDILATLGGWSSDWSTTAVGAFHPPAFRKSLFEAVGVKESCSCDKTFSTFWFARSNKNQQQQNIHTCSSLILRKGALSNDGSLLLDVTLGSVGKTIVGASLLPRLDGSPLVTVFDWEESAEKFRFQINKKKLLGSSPKWLGHSPEGFLSSLDAPELLTAIKQFKWGHQNLLVML